MRWVHINLKDGTAARLSVSEDGAIDHSEPWTSLRLPSGHELLVPTEAIEVRDDEFYLPVALEDLGLELTGSPESVVIPVIADELEIIHHTVETERVKVKTTLELHDALIDERLRSDLVEVERVRIDREVGGPQPVRQEGDLTIIPIVEEVLVVQKRFVLKEEVRVRRRRVDLPHQETMKVRRQRVEIVREPANRQE